MRMQLLKHTKHDIVNSLSLLPKTQHDLCSFLVDLFLHTVSVWFFCRSYPEIWTYVGSYAHGFYHLPFQEMMLCFSVNGLFMEGGYL